MRNWYKIAQHLQNVETLNLDEREVTRAIRDALIAEQEAIKQYETIVDSTSNEKVKEVLQDIADEEKVHVGELLELLSKLMGDSEEEFIEEGRSEVKEGKCMKIYKIAQSSDKFNCPQCHRKGDMANPSSPILYDCPICDIMWNPDNLPAFTKGSRGDRPSLKYIFHTQNKMWTDDRAETMLEDFIYKALRAGYSKDRIIQGLEEFYRQHPSSGEGIFERAIAKL